MSVSRRGGSHPSAPRAVRIGLSGPIGCGKSTIGRWLGDLGAVVIDADAVARAVSGSGTPIERAILERFGGAVESADGGVDRSALARVVFAEPAALRDLEAIVRPAVRPRIVAALDAADAAGAPAVVVEAIGLLDSGLAADCDEVWLIECDEASQRARLSGRGTPAPDAERRIRSQRGLVERLVPVATRRIDTSGEAAAVRATVEAAFVEALAAPGR